MKVHRGRWGKPPYIIVGGEWEASLSSRFDLGSADIHLMGAWVVPEPIWTWWRREAPQFL